MDHGDLSQALPVRLRQRAVQRLSFIQKRRDNWSAAIELWHLAAEDGEIYAHVELAKYHEHRLHDFEEAARWTTAALQRIADPGYPHASRQRWLPGLQHRLARVQRRARKRRLSGGRPAETKGTGRVLSR
jgi:hypothetical protein